MPSESRPKRRSHDRADRHARNRLLTRVGVTAFTVIAALVIYWWYSAQDPARDGAPNWFPDGRTLVFSAEVGAGRSDIFRMALDGSGRRQLTDHPANDASPAVSPDGTRIAFESERDGNAEIYLMDPDGGNLVRLTNDPARDGSPAWSPDGRRIVFTSDRDNRAAADVYVMNADGTGLERLTNDLTNWAPQFSPDGTKVAVQVNLDVVVLDLTDGTRRRLTADPQNGMNPTWSPDGSRIAFVTTRGGRAEIFTMNADGTNPEVLVTMAAGSVIDPRWSPDGTRVAFVLVPETVPGAEQEELQAIYTVELASGVLTRLSK